jgi:CRISPR/Cas system-associated exonuclease Cas4 (RecB family)
MWSLFCLQQGPEEHRSMIELIKEREEQVSTLHQIPHISHAQVNRYLHCPEQYRLYYIEKLRPRVPSASLVFGQMVHLALAHLFRNGNGPVQTFRELWDEIRPFELQSGHRDTWESLQAAGMKLLEKFVKEELPRLDDFRKVERVFELDITQLDLPFIGIIDLVAKLDGKLTLVDFKTSASAYDEHEAALSDQLTAYQLAEPEAEQVALCIFVKTKEPRIDWHMSKRPPEQLVEYLAKAKVVAHDITAGQFYKRPGKWCSWCDYLPVCLRDTQKIEESLVQIR